MHERTWLRMMGLILGIGGGLGPASAAAAAGSVNDAVVKVFVTQNPMNFYLPWQSRGSVAGTGSGCIIPGRRILTNAHVVADQTFIQVRKESDPKKYTAELEAIAHDCDLAILKVKDPSFFDGTTALELGDLPRLRDQVTVVGFPLGGDKLSVTEGVVSRVEIIPYGQSTKRLLAVQIDAAINPGNSGGPVVKDGRLVGLAMQVMRSGQNIGYMIPPPVIAHFLADLEDGRYDGFPELGIEYTNTENPALRAAYAVPREGGGVLVTYVQPFSSAEGFLEEEDVILDVDGVGIGTDGTFAFRGSERLGFSHLVHRHRAGEALEARILREGRTRKVEIPLRVFKGLVPPPHHFDSPSYFIYGGLVFSVLSMDLLKSWGDKWWEKAPPIFLEYLIGPARLNRERRRDVVVLLTVLPDDVNVGYHSLSNLVIDTIDGEPVRSLRDLVTRLDHASGPRVTLEATDKTRIILDTAAVRRRAETILRRYHVPARASDDVKAWLDGGWAEH